MPQFQTAIFNGVGTHDTANTALAGVLRDTDGSINVGKTKTTQVASSGGISLASNVVTGAVTLTANNALVSANAGSGAFAITLPSVSASVGLIFLIAKNDSSGNAVTVTGSGSDKITVTGSSANTYALSAQGNQIQLWSDGTQWLGIKS